ncbi:hypothetical protein HI914_06488 [Erysiphe necator]|nr:hypothetical protein HI914_06486 [Erysiphe necator]KAI6245190.1 hypothetical protein HI914_06488 [Erysiphe necator]
MSSNMAQMHCSRCKCNRPSTMFVRNEQANTFFKQCITCRTRQNIRRQTLRHQLSAALPQTEEAGTGITTITHLFEHILRY